MIVIVEIFLLGLGLLGSYQAWGDQLLLVGDRSLSREQRQAAIDRIASQEDDVDVRTLLPVYLAILDDPDEDPRLRIFAVSGLLVTAMRDRENARRLRAAAPSFVECLAAEDPKLRENCALGLAAYVTPPLSAERFSTIVAAASDPAWQVRRYAIQVLQQVDLPAQETLDAVVAALEVEAHPDVVQSGLTAIQRHGISSSRLLAFAVSRLSDLGTTNREDTISLLIVLGPQAAEALPILRKVSQDPLESNQIRQAARQAIARIEGG